MTEKPKWDVTVRKYGRTYITEFAVGVQGFRLAEVEVDGLTNHDEAWQHATFIQIMFLRALEGLGVKKPGGVPDIKKVFAKHKERAAKKGRRTAKEPAAQAPRRASRSSSKGRK